LVAIPFSCKVLEQSAKSKVFRPPNPWLMSLLRLLMELHQTADLRLNLKFDIEVLMKNLKLEGREIEASSLLKDRPKGVQPQFPQAAPKPTTPAPEGDKTSRQTPTSEQAPAGSLVTFPYLLFFLCSLASFLLIGSSSHFLSSLSFEKGHSRSPPGQLSEAGSVNLAAIVSQISATVSAPIFNQNPTVKRYISLAIERAVRDLFPAVVERSAKIACITTREMILKDFAMEPDEQKMRTAANFMVQNLASHLALVACKDPLRITIGNHLRTYLQSHSSDQSLVDQGILAVNDEANISALCNFFETSSSEKGCTSFTPFVSFSLPNLSTTLPVE